MGAQAIKLLADIRTGRDQHGLLMEACRVEGMLTFEQFCDLGFQPGADCVGLAGGSSLGLVDES